MSLHRVLPPAHRPAVECFSHIFNISFKIARAQADNKL